MGKLNKNNKGKSKEEVKILNVATDEDTIVIDTSALDKELKDTEGASLVMPITGGMSDKISKKDKKESKKDKDEKASSVSETFSKFLENQDEVTTNSIKELLTKQNLVELGKFVLEHPEAFMEAYLKSNQDAKDETKDDKVPQYEDEKVQTKNKMEEEEMSTLVRVKLSNKDVSKLRENLGEEMEKLDKLVGVKLLFDAVQEELGVNFAKIINKLIDKLDNYDEDKFNAFIVKTIAKLENSKLGDIVRVLTGESITHLMNLLFDNEKDALHDVEETAKYRYEKIIAKCNIENMDEDDFENRDEMMVAIIRKFIRESLKEYDKIKVDVEDKKSEEFEMDSFGLLKSIMAQISNTSDSKPKTQNIEKTTSGNNLCKDSIVNRAREFYRSAGIVVR